MITLVWPDGHKTKGKSLEALYDRLAGKYRTQIRFRYVMSLRAWRWSHTFVSLIGSKENFMRNLESARMFRIVERS